MAGTLQDVIDNAAVGNPKVISVREIIIVLPLVLRCCVELNLKIAYKKLSNAKWA